MTFTRKTLLLACCLLLLLPVLAYALTGKVIAVADGDTITVLDKNNQETKIRLYGVDCPEKSQDFGTKAKQFTANMVFGKIVEVKEIDRDRYGRTVGIVLIEEKTLNAEILKSGLAWVYSRYCNQAFCSDWQVIQNVAQKARIGLWSHPNPVPPWEYRKSGKSLSESEKTPQADSGLYHGNSKSHVFHRKECRYFNCKNCTVIFQNRQEAIQAGFKPCGVCRP